MSEVEIEYCVPCGFLPAAEETEHALLLELGPSIEVLRMKPGHGGVFKVSVDGEMIFDKGDDGYDVETIVERVDRRLRAGTRS